MTLGQNGVLRYGHFGEFLEFFWDRMAKTSLKSISQKMSPKWPSYGLK